MDNLYNAIFKGLAPVAKTSVQEALDAGKTPQEIIDDSMIPARSSRPAVFSFPTCCSAPER